MTTLNGGTNIVETTRAATAGGLSPEIQVLLFALSVPGLFCLMLLLGRRLKRRHGVQIGWLYHPFALGVAVSLSGVILGLKWPFLYHAEWATVIFGSVFLIALVDRYLWG
ncbi:MAG TPA: hypothetical protein VMO20_04665, partial [Candidatus Acidoferrum sp.]|nr:hypothetical protein [Candidatus Acidoferrum sp.]